VPPFATSTIGSGNFWGARGIVDEIRVKNALPTAACHGSMLHLLIQARAILNSCELETASDVPDGALPRTLSLKDLVLKSSAVPTIARSGCVKLAPPKTLDPSIRSTTMETAGLSEH